MIERLRRRLKQQDGFTLMELMIVVVILGVLTGIAVPTYTGIVDRARDAADAANVQALNNATRMYDIQGDQRFSVTLGEQSLSIAIDSEGEVIIELDDDEFDYESGTGTVAQMLTTLFTDYLDGLPKPAYSSGSYVFDADRNRWDAQ